MAVVASTAGDSGRTGSVVDGTTEPNHYVDRPPSLRNALVPIRPYRDLKPLEEAADTVLGGGHLWLQEYVPGPVLAVAMDESGLLRFGSDGRPLDDPPPSLARAVDHVRRSFDRDRFRAGVEDVTEFVFYGVATRNEGREYAWADVAPFLGLDIWTESRGRYVAPDVAERVFESINLDPVPAFAKEVPTAEFTPVTYEPPVSHWNDGPAAGVLVRNKGGGVGLHGYEPTADGDPGEDPSTVIKTAVSRHVDRVLAELGADAATVDPDVLADRMFAVVARVAYGPLRGPLETRPEGVRDDVGRTVRSLLRARVTGD